MSTRSLICSGILAGVLIALGCESSANSQSSSSKSEVSTQLASASPAAVTDKQRSDHDRPGFATYEVKGVLWVFAEGSKDQEEFLAKGPSARSVTRVGAGPNRMSLRAADAETIDGYLAARPGFVVVENKGLLWVFKEGSKDHEEYLQKGFSARSVTRVAAGPGGKSLRAVDAETIDAYLAAKPGFVVIENKGLLWVFKEGSKDHEEYLQKGFSARSVTRVAAGPGGKSLRAVDAETIDAYLAAR